jgi:predicted phosphoribosyltransferase
MMAALHAMRARAPSRLICAVPVASVEAARKVACAADDVVALRTPNEFYAVGQFYRRFDQVQDAEVIGLLREAAARKAGRGAQAAERP